MEAASKAMNEGKYELAREIINEQITDANQRKQFLANLERQMIQGAIDKGKLDETRPLLERLRPEERAIALVQFAAKAAKRDNKLAIEILTEAQVAVNTQPTNSIEMMVLLQIAGAFARLDASRSFDIIEPMVEQLNGLLAAVAALDGFDFWPSFKDGELMGAGPNIVVSLAFTCIEGLRLLARDNFERAKTLADKFARSDVRIMARLAVARGALSDQASATNSILMQMRSPFFRPYQ